VSDTEILSPVLRRYSDRRVAFWCPGCNSSHPLSVEGANHVWGFDGNFERPTFSPSVLFRTGHFIPEHQGDTCWCTYNEKQRAEGKRESSFKCGICHSFVRNGRIEFLGDCTHELAGQTVDLPPWPEDR
jgi:hypothetical protein